MSQTCCNGGAPLGVVLSIISALPGVASAQDQVFGLENPPTSSIKLETVVVRSGESIDVSELGDVDGVAITANITLEGSSSYVRIILIDKHGNEYQVFESNSLLDGAAPIALDTYCEETCSLGNVGASTLLVLLDGAEVQLEQVSASEAVRTSAAIGRSVSVAAERQSKQLADKIERVRDGIRANGYQWVASETPVARMTYAEKKRHVCGPLTNLYGFEYYAGGVFELPEPGTERVQNAATVASSYVDEFSWRNRHGQDWLTSVKNQRGCGSCWAFAATGATELLANIYFNQHANLDLAEQDALSCSGAGSCSGGWPHVTLNYYATQGVVDEGCFPYAARDLMCSAKCTDPGDRVTIGGSTTFDPIAQSEDDLKAMLLRGAVSGGVYWWRHAMTLAGFRVLKAGDEIFYNSDQLGSGSIKIPDGDPLVGRTAWYFKNSWGTAYGDQGYVYVVTDIQNIGWTLGVNPPVRTMHLSERDIVCEDADGDGYFNWGVGPMPSSCPADVRPEPDGDDSDDCSGPMNEYGFMAELCEEIDLRHITHLSGLITKSSTPLRVSDYPRWWQHHAPDTVYIHFKAVFGQKLDGLSVDVAGVRTELRGRHDVVAVANAYPEPIHVVLHADHPQKLIVAWRSIGDHR